MPTPTGDLARRAGQLRWYHTLELPGGVETQGEYDLRPTVPLLPLPADMSGMRCIDIGARDGFYGFEMERRGADVVSIDINDPGSVHFPHEAPPASIIQRELDDGERAFRFAREALGSKVERRHVSVYDLDPTDVGTFDFAVMGTLLHHLRDPVRALLGVRRIVTGRFLLCAAIMPGIDALRPRPLAEIEVIGGPYWSLGNPAGYRRWVESAGFEVLSVSRPYFIDHGSGGTDASLRSALRSPLRGVVKRLVLRRGIPHVAVLAAPEARIGGR